MTCLHPSVTWRADRVRVSAPRTRNLIAASSGINWKILGAKLPIISRGEKYLIPISGDYFFAGQVVPGFSDHGYGHSRNMTTAVPYDIIRTVRVIGYDILMSPKRDGNLKPTRS